MLWTRLDIPCPFSLTDIVSAMVFGETGRGPSIEPGATEDCVQAYVPQGEAERARQRLAGRLVAAGPPLAERAQRIAVTDLADVDWGAAWREHFKPFRVGERIVVKPSWEPWPPSDAPTAARETDVVLEIDPGGAFGTGSHATTQLALEALEREVSGGETVIDAGCGSGILSLAALKLGAARMIAVDVDPAAVECTAACLQPYLRESKAFVMETDGLAAVYARADVIVANITADLVVKVGETVCSHLRREGRYIATGLLDTAAESVTRALEIVGLVLRRTDHLDGWACLTLVPGRP
jgi:ribosomal protein L11 methyltransferase